MKLVILIFLVKISLILQKCDCYVQSSDCPCVAISLCTFNQSKLDEVSQFDLKCADSNHIKCCANNSTTSQKSIERIQDSSISDDSGKYLLSFRDFR